ncbi:MAG: 4-phosphopantetheinyl transferase [Microbacteriaceae bacterium]|nr:4-phosphopantetheinyl transferase [Microbacteriaceae bacterium]
MSVRVVILESAGRDADRALLAKFGTVTQVCPDCGGDHGRPVVAEPGRWVSLSRSGGLVAVAFSTAGPVGVDLESRAAVARHPVRGLRHPDAREWTTKEAVLKADGRGLRVDPAELVFVDGRLAEWAGCPVPLATVRLHHFAATDDLVGTVAWFGEPAEVEVDVEVQRRLGSGLS